MSEPSSKDTVLKTAMVYVCGGKNFRYFFVCSECCSFFCVSLNEPCSLNVRSFVDDKNFISIEALISINFMFYFVTNFVPFRLFFNRMSLRE